jgi:Phosphate-selective porin O and P
MRRLLRLLALALTLAAVPTGVTAQTEISARGAKIRIGGRLHSQYTASSVTDAENDFFFRRVRIIADITVNDFVSARVQPDFSGGKTALQDAYVRLAFSKAFRLSMGQFKRAFDLFELSSSTDLSLIERDGRVEGLGGCAGVGSVCSYSRLTEKLGFAGRDQGIKIDGSSGSVSYLASVTNGTGINRADENDAKSYSGRVTVAASDRVRISGQLAIHDYVDSSDDNQEAVGWGADLDVGGWRDGVHFQAALSGGDNWKAPDASDEPATFFAVQGVLSYYKPLEGDRISGVEPLLRLSFGDPDTGLDDDGGALFTPGFMLYFQGKNKIGANVDVYSPQSGDTEFSFKLQTFLYF